MGEIKEAVRDPRHGKDRDGRSRFSGRGDSRDDEEANGDRNIKASSDGLFVRHGETGVDACHENKEQRRELCDTKLQDKPVGCVLFCLYRLPDEPAQRQPQGD